MKTPFNCVNAFFSQGLFEPGIELRALAGQPVLVHPQKLLLNGLLDGLAAVGENFFPDHPIQFIDCIGINGMAILAVAIFSNPQYDILSYFIHAGYRCQLLF
jgi:hypothetical protein